MGQIQNHQRRHGNIRQARLPSPPDWHMMVHGYFIFPARRRLVTVPLQQCLRHCGARRRTGASALCRPRRRVHSGWRRAVATDPGRSGRRRVRCGAAMPQQPRRQPGLRRAQRLPGVVDPAQRRRPPGPVAGATCRHPQSRAAKQRHDVDLRRGQRSRRHLQRRALRAAPAWPGWQRSSLSLRHPTLGATSVTSLKSATSFKSFKSFTPARGQRRAQA